MVSRRTRKNTAPQEKLESNIKTTAEIMEVENHAGPEKVPQLIKQQTQKQ